MKDKRCKGCRVNPTCLLTVKPLVYIEKCPCMDCIVKMMCVEPCEDFKKHLNNKIRRI